MITEASTKDKKRKRTDEFPAENEGVTNENGVLTQPAWKKSRLATRAEKIMVFYLLSVSFYQTLICSNLINVM